MEQILTLKVDLEHPDDAKFAIDKAVEAYEQSKKHWDSFELNEAKSRARYILYSLCCDGCSMIWTVTDGAVGLTISLTGDKSTLFVPHDLSFCPP
jgi:hypothetical protein